MESIQRFVICFVRSCNPHPPEPGISTWGIRPGCLFENNRQKRGTDMSYSFLDGYWDTAKSSNSYWAECKYGGHRLVLATIEWPPKDIPSEHPRRTRHIVFVIDGSEDSPSRSLSYEPAYSGPGVFLGDAFNTGVRVNHGNIPEMTREEFWPMAFAKLFGSNPAPELSPLRTNRWKFWQ
jgi:hypothetical protein